MSVTSLFDASNRWLLPEGVDEFLPEQAERLERFRRTLLDVFHSWGYELVIPPLVEYIESLLVGTGTELDIETFKLIDQATGRLMGVRADMTPQVARIDAHRIAREGPSRLCYLDTVLHTRQDTFARSRTPLQLGAELFGHAGLESDIEVLRLMAETLRVAGISDFQLDVGHVGIFRELARGAQLDESQEDVLFRCLQRKAKSEIEDYLATINIDSAYAGMLISLVELNGHHGILDEAQQILKKGGRKVVDSIEQLKQLDYSTHNKVSHTPLHYDLAELRGYRYQTGIVFAAFAVGHGQEIARGGRYDEIGKLYGKARPATGFSADLKTLMALSDAFKVDSPVAIAAPWSDCEVLQGVVADLRQQGERIIFMLPEQSVPMSEQGCNRMLVKVEGNWQVETLAE